MAKKIAIIGCGSMGEAFARRLNAKYQLFLCDRDFTWAEELAKKVGAQAKNVTEAVKEAEIVILAIKPQDLNAFALQADKFFSKQHLLISMLAGTSRKTLKEKFKKPLTVRIAPNLAVKHGKGIIGLVEDDDLSPEKKKLLEELFSSMGHIFWLPEEKINALTALVGSGPAFALVLIESMVEAGIAMGFPASMAQQMVLQMWEGTLSLMDKSKAHPAEIKWQITSPAGTTIAGIEQMEAHAIRAGIMKAFLAAYQRGQELTQK